MIASRLGLLIGLLIGAVGCRRGHSEVHAREAGSHALRIVTLTPSLTEIVFALGRGGDLVGVDQFSDFPAAAVALPKVGDFLTPNVEAIVGLAPDVVLMSDVQKDAQATLSRVGVHALALPVLTVNDVHAAIATVGREIHAEKAARELSERLDRELGEAAALGAAATSRPRVLIVVDRDPGGLGGLVVAGPGSFLDDLVTRAGGRNVVESGGGYLRVSPDLVVDRAPDVILDAIHTDDAARAAADWNALPGVPAVRDHRVIVFADRAVVTPGPRLGAVVKRIAQALHPPH